MGRTGRTARREVPIESDSLEAVRAHLVKAEELLACMPEMLVLGRIAAGKPRGGKVDGDDGGADAVAAVVGVVRWRIDQARRLLLRKLSSNTGTSSSTPGHGVSDSGG
jgi:hypothetical protein